MDRTYQIGTRPLFGGKTARVFPDADRIGERFQRFVGGYSVTMPLLHANLLVPSPSCFAASARATLCGIDGGPLSADHQTPTKRSRA